MPVEQQPGAGRAAWPPGFGEGGAALLQGHENLAARRGITPEQLEGLFNFSYERYLVGDYEAACPGFELLCLYDHGNLKYLQGYGYCLQALRHYPKAAACLYFTSTLMERGSQDWAETRLAAARLLLRAGEREQARAMLQGLLEALPDAAAPQREQALALREALDAAAPAA